ncbi:hypothetical protein DBV05_g6712 [Lasiodiplodia theobromae]|uniref:ZZ-type domain-containing protein n=1 Tax=Lasiodiplodia theobromae TaxID=45133 RepID=A0A5N5DA23_9PEZI|nr:hypothetical protein DBV05_g6712 [Lasiodiplodia theobromae]
MSLLEEPCGEPVTCDRCKDIIVDEWWHCDICSAGDYDICCRCIQKGRRCMDSSHDLTKWRDDIDLGNGHKGVSLTVQKLPGIPKGFHLSLPRPTRSGRPPSQKDSNDVISPSPAPPRRRKRPPGHLNLSTLHKNSLHLRNIMPKTPEPDSSTSDMGSEREKFFMEAFLNEIRPDRAKPTIRRSLFGTRSLTTPPSLGPSMTAVPTSSAEHSTRTERTTMADNPSASNPAAAGAIVQHFDTAQAARHHLNGNVPRWTTPYEHPDSSGRPTTPSGEYAYVRAAVHSISVGLRNASLAYTSATDDQSANNKAHETRRRTEARAWLLFEALKRLHDGGCMLRPSADFSNNFGGELGDRRLGFRERWVAVCKMLQRFDSAAGMVAWASIEEPLEAYVAAPLAMGRKLEQDKRLANEGSEWKKPKLPPTLKRLPPIERSSSDEQEAREEKKRKLNLEPLASDDLAESSEDEEMKAQKAREAREALFDRLLKNYV